MSGTDDHQDRDDHQNRVDRQEVSSAQDTLLQEDTSFAEKVEALTPEVYQSLKRALELGKWPNGDRLTSKQQAICMDAILHYDHANLPEEQRVGYLKRKACSGEKGSDNSDMDQGETLGVIQFRK